MNDKITHFTQSQFELESFREILVAIFPQIHFIEPNKRTLPHSILQSQIAICTPFKLGNKNFGIYIFECDSIRAKVGIHTELKSILKATGLDAILAIFHTPDSTSLAEGVRGWVDSAQSAESFNDGQDTSAKNAQRGSILDEKSWLRSHEQGNKTKASIDEASGKLQDLSLKDNAPTEFRLSLITSGYDYEANKPTYSNLKRQSFILGHTKTATAQKALANLIAKAQKSPLTQKDLEEAFSQEPVSKEFYERYKKHYDAICAKLTQANIAHIFANYKGISDSHKAIESFAKKLLGRIVFLYFLQKKGYLGVPRDKSYGEGDTNFLHNLFCKARQQNINFYSEYLCPLFFDSLNARKEDDYSALFDCKIPFLNGGLFEDEFANNKSCHIERSEISKTSICHTEALAEVSQVSQNRDISVSTKPQYDNATIFRANKAHFLIAQVLDNPTFEAIFDFFESYNFTIEESTPTDIEVSIDPEMLGKVFENLIDYNKESGAFYTPREIVHYMAQNALISHFSRHYPSHKEQIQNLIANKQSDNDFIHKNGAEIKAILLNLKILDPAIGSGAFPMGILSEIMQVLETLDKTMSDAQKAQHKRDIIANCIYGIDIDADAIAIARLRFWLSIAVDEVSPSPLPNLDFKFMQGNSLLESLSIGKECIEIIPRDFMREIPSTKLFDENADKIIFSHDIAKSLQNLFLDYYAQNDAHKKHTLKSQIKSIMSNAFEVRIAQIQKDIDSKTKELSTPNNDKTKKRLTNEIDSLLHQIPALQSLANDFITNDFHTDKVFLYNFFFANIINEGGFDIVIGNPPYIRQESIPNKQAILSAFADFACSTADIYTYFFAKALDLLAPQGILTYIVSNKFTRAGYGKNLRSLLLRHTIESYTDFNGIKIFENAIVDSCILQVSKSAPQGNQIRYAKDLSSKNCDFIPQDSLNAQAFIFADSHTLALKQKIEKIGTPLKEWDIEINYGIKTGYNEAFIIDTATKEAILDSCESSAERKRTEQIIKPILRGRDIKRYSYEWANLWLIGTHNGYESTRHCEGAKRPKQSIKIDCHESANADSRNDKIKIPPIDINDYPTLKKYLDNFYPKLEKRTDKGTTPYNLRNCAYVEDFEKEKIVYPCIMAKESCFIYDNIGFYAPAPANIITGENLKYILACLNSTLIYFAMRNFYMGGGIEGELKTNNLEKIPIPKITTKNKKIADEIVNLVDKILETKAQDSTANTTALESQIDELVYKLYDLDSHEIKIIEN